MLDLCVGGGGISTCLGEVVVVVLGVLVVGH